LSNDAGIVIPVIAGLAVGIVLIAVFASIAKPAFSLSDDEILKNVKNLPEVQAFYERYIPLEQIGRDGTTTYVYYLIGRTWPAEDDQSDGFQWVVEKELRLTVKLDQFGRTSMTYQCAGAITFEDTATVELMRTTECLERL
jgi:hypothetical protein